MKYKIGQLLWNDRHQEYFFITGLDIGVINEGCLGIAFSNNVSSYRIYSLSILYGYYEIVDVIQEQAARPDRVGITGRSRKPKWILN